MLERVCELFQGHPDLLRDFVAFLPEGAQDQARARLARAPPAEGNEKAEPGLKATAREQDSHLPRTDGPSFRGIFCPITQDIMADPVVASDGHSYERKAIVRWFASNLRSPLTNEPIASTVVVPNLALRSLIHDIVEMWRVQDEQKEQKELKGQKEQHEQEPAPLDA